MRHLAPAREVAQMVMEAEKVGVGLCRLLGEAAPDDEAKEVFEWIQEDEERDVLKLARLAAALDGQYPEGIDPAEYDRYVKILWEIRIFKDHDTCRELASNACDVEEAAKLASLFERELILFLHELHRSVPEAARVEVGRLLNGEYNHLRLLHALALLKHP